MKSQESRTGCSSSSISHVLFVIIDCWGGKIILNMSVSENESFFICFADSGAYARQQAAWLKAYSQCDIWVHIG